jgi:hypothetical protein
MGVFLMRTSVVPEHPEPALLVLDATETEDVYFCPAPEAGHTIYIDHDLSKSVGHVGSTRTARRRRWCLV